MNPSAAAATDHAPKTITVRGVVIALPDHIADLYLDFPMNWREQLDHLQFEEVVLSITRGHPFKPALSLREGVQVVQDTLAAYGMTLGESSASSSSSPTTGSPSRPTSSRRTASTSPRRGTSAPSRRGASGS